jgi:hypothetical protein
MLRRSISGGTRKSATQCIYLSSELEINYVDVALQ